MSLFWEPRWVRKRYLVDGVDIVTCEDEVSGLILCPICEKIDEYCPENKSTSRVRENLNTFFTPRDLIYHLKSHKNQKGLKFRLEKYGEPEEGEEEEEEEDAI
ncbi:MAG: hypothetical protein QXZ10_02635 [Sulfolobales archaeon]